MNIKQKKKGDVKNGSCTNVTDNIYSGGTILFTLEISINRKTKSEKTDGDILIYLYAYLHLLSV